MQWLHRVYQHCTLLLSFAPYGVNIFFIGGAYFNQNRYFSFSFGSFLRSCLWYRNLIRVEHDIHWVFLLRIFLDGIRIPLPYLVQVPFMCELRSLDYVYPVFNLFFLCNCLPVGLLNMWKKTFSPISNRFRDTLFECPEELKGTFPEVFSDGPGRCKMSANLSRNQIFNQFLKRKETCHLHR